MLELCLLGCGGMMPLPYRKLTSLMARYNGNSILIDCGEGTQVAIKEKGWSFKPIEVICFTHYHADHTVAARASFNIWESTENRAAVNGRTKRIRACSKLIKSHRTRLTVSDCFS